MKVVIGSPVKGFKLKTALISYLKEQKHEVVDVGCYETDHFVKYTSTGERVAKALQDGVAEIAVNICGSGTGAAIGVNKFSGVLACACESVTTAKLARLVNGANCLCLGEDIVSENLAQEMLDVFLITVPFDNPSADPKIRNFWQEAHNEMLPRGVKAVDRKLETL